MNNRKNYRVIFDFCLLLSLFFHLISFQAIRFFNVIDLEPSEALAPSVQIKVVDIPKTRWKKQPHQPIGPPVPVIPLPSENEILPEDVNIETLETIGRQLCEIPPPLNIKNNNDTTTCSTYSRFIPYQKPPVPVGGMASLNRYLSTRIKPWMDGMSGEYEALITARGRVNSCLPIIPSGSAVFDKMVIKGIEHISWKPPEQRGKKINARIRIPVRVRFIFYHY